MTDEYAISREIVEEHESRIMQLRKYYPFFKLTDETFSQYKDGKYQQLDMGYLLMAILRYFIEQNNFKETEVTYEELEKFLSGLYRQDFGLNLLRTEEKELSSYIFDKIKNNGKPFLFSYFDPVSRVKKQMRIRLIEGHMEENAIYYSITTDGIEFYLDTKERGEESAISIEQLLLEKMIRSRNFKGGTEVVKRINNEVKKLQLQKNEVLACVSQDVFGGIKACEEFMERTARWFEEEQKLFKKNNELIRRALQQAKQDEQTERNNSQYSSAMAEIYTLESELQRALQKHRELLHDCMELQKKTDALVSRAKIRSLHTAFDFERFGSLLMERERADQLETLVLPLLKPKIKKTFSLELLDELLTIRSDKEEIGEKVPAQREEQYVFVDELEEQRILHNYQIFLYHLLTLLADREQFDLRQYAAFLTEKFGEKIVTNGDFYSFCACLCQKQAYSLDSLNQKKDTVLEEAMAKLLESDITNKEQFLSLSFSMKMKPEDTILLNENIEITNVEIRRNHGRA